MMAVEKWQLVLAAAGMLATIAGSVGAILWWVVQKIHRFVSTLDRVTAAVKAHAEALIMLGDEVKRLAGKSASAEHQLVLRERETNKLEGKIDTSNQLMMGIVGDMREATANLNAVWRLLDKLHPDAVPKRASDRG